jgi:hypothetical protein
LAALLIQNRAKTGQQKVLEPDGATPSQPQSGGSSGSFDLLEVTAVGGAQEGAAAGSGGSGMGAAGAPTRRNYPTPGGGLPGLLARTQLGLGDAIRSFRESGGRTDAAPPTTASPPAAAVPAAVTAPSSADDVRPAESPPPASSGETATGAAVDPGDGAAAVSGPVFELATGPMAGSGPVSGPVFDLVSGPFSGPATTVNAPETALATTPASEAAPAPTATPASGATPAPTAEQGAPRQSGATPASGRLAALLAESRKRTGRHETLDKGAEPSAAGAGPAVAAPNPAAALGPSPSAPQSPLEDVATMRVPGAEVAQKKGPGFAATLLGLPAPELTPPVTRTTSAVAGGAGTAGRARYVRDGSPEGGADRNTPLPVEGEATERSLLSTGDMRARWSRNSEEQKRTTDIIDIVRPNRPGIRTAALILGGAAVLVMILVGVARVNRSGGEEKAAVTTVVPAAPAPAAPAVPPAAPTPGATTAVEERKPTAGIGEAPEREAARGETKAAPVEANAAAEEGEAPPPLPSAFRETSSPPTARGDGEPKRKVARSETRRSDTRRAEPKTRRRNVEARSVRVEGTATAASYETPRPRVAQPLRPLQADPDGTLPLGMQ